MTTFVIIMITAGIAYLVLFHKPYHYSEADLKKWFSTKLVEIAENLENDIKRDTKGEYPHAGLQTFDKRGSITYLLVDKSYTRFDISDKNNLDTVDIIETQGYGQLENKVRALNLTMRLEEKAVEGDGVNTFDEIDEYIDDFPRYYTVTIGGW